MLVLDCPKLRWKFRKHLMACLLVLMLAFFALAGIEILGQLYFVGNPYYFFDQRFIYTTADSFRNIGKFWTYKPRSTIDEIGIYRTALGRFFKEYECHYETDRNGFFNPDSERMQYDVLLLGDSFTSGSAGCSWMPALQAKLPNYAIYNAALPGTGVANWAEIEGYLVAQGYQFRHVIGVFIIDDFWRTLRWKRDAELDCLHDLRRCTWQVFYPLDPEADLLKVSERRATHQLTKKIEYFWRRNLWVTHLLYSSVPPLPRFWAKDAAASNLPDYTTEAFDRIVQMSKGIELVHVP